jgi:UDP-2-acetamido-2,6-beta-L-arabino-hexul-4-ose reductase
LAQQLIDACVKVDAKPHILFSSSTQESMLNTYGNAKKQARSIIESWANENKGKSSGLIIPNVFGPFGKPNYNSVVATFCHKICRGEEIKVNNDSTINLIYVNELIEEFYQELTFPTYGELTINHRHEITVLDLAQKLKNFYNTYMISNQFPNLDHPFDLALFNTFRCYIPTEHYPVLYKKNSDTRGTFIELAKTTSKGQSSYSSTNPGYTRGNHFHTRKAERFSVISGKARISLRKVDSEEVIHYELDGENPAYVDMPIWYTHNITNIGSDTLLTYFWINEPYDAEDPDTWFVEV